MDPSIEGGKGVYRYEKSRLWAIAVAALVVIATVGAVALEPSRSFVAMALLGTPTSTSTPLRGPTPANFTRRVGNSRAKAWTPVATLAMVAVSTKTNDHLSP
jgi:hypothetical protein